MLLGVTRHVVRILKRKRKKKFIIVLIFFLPMWLYWQIWGLTWRIASLALFFYLSSLRHFEDHIKIEKNLINPPEFLVFVIKISHLFQIICDVRFYSKNLLEFVLVVNSLTHV